MSYHKHIYMVVEYTNDCIFGLVASPLKCTFGALSLSLLSDIEEYK